jgi:thiol-disulfide isomerase/thioredoxin
VILNFFADWCPACVAEMPDFEHIHQQFGDDVVFLGIDRSGSDDGAYRLIDSTGITYAVATDRDGSIFNAFGGLAMPTTVFIAADGSIVDQSQRRDFRRRPSRPDQRRLLRSMR